MKCLDDSCDATHCAKCGGHMAGWYLAQGTVCSACQEQGTNQMSPTKLANVFSEILTKELGQDTVDQIVHLNSSETNPSTCHSHDFCDANVYMNDAFLECYGREFGMEDTAIWNEAWEIAKSNGFRPVFDLKATKEEVQHLIELHWQMRDFCRQYNLPSTYHEQRLKHLSKEIT